MNAIPALDELRALLRQHGGSLRWDPMTGYDLALPDGTARELIEEGER